jgi:hypothetical protein
VYVALLGVALGAMLLGCLLMLLVLNRYEFNLKVSALPAQDRPAALALTTPGGISEKIVTIRL